MQPLRGPWSVVQEICNKTFAHSYSGVQSIECTVLSPGMFGCCRINVLSVACGLEHTLALCRDGVRDFNLLLNLESFFIVQTPMKYRVSFRAKT